MLGGERAQMSKGCLGQPVRLVSTLECADNATPAPGIRARDERACEEFEVVELECEPAERISGEGIESGRNEDQLWDETFCCRIDPAFQRIDVFRASESAGFGDVPDGPVRTSITRCTGSGIPWPLMH